MQSRLDSPEAWRITFAALVILAIAFGSPHIVNVALKQIAEELGGQRSIPSAANALAWLGTGFGGIAMGLIADRIGIRWTVMFGAAMVAGGLALSSSGQAWHLYVGHGVLIGLLGNAGINAPLYVYVTRWFERRRGTAVALIASGQYVAGAIWPPAFERVIASVGWRQTMLYFGLLVATTVIPLAAAFLKSPPVTTDAQAASTAGGAAGRVAGLSSGSAFTALSIASFLCCVPMAMPQAHLIAFCGDLGIAASRGAMMLSTLLIFAFLSRQFWGWLSDRIGGLATLVTCSATQAITVSGFLFTQDEAGLFLVAAAFGLGFSGLIPAYIITARQLFPASEASWRMPALLLTGTGGMAFGGWSAGAIYDSFGSYQPAFATGLAANILNLVILATLLMFAMRHARTQPARV
jgi:MFS family permease